MKSFSIEKSRPLLSARSRSLTLIFGTLLMLFGVSPAVWAEEHVVTIYFGGTGLTENGWEQGNTQTGRGNTRWDTPSLLAELYHYHDDSADTQHKIFIPGVGAKETPTNSGSPDNHCPGNPKEFPEPPLDKWHAFMQQALSNHNICRNWKQTIAEAFLGLQNILDSLADDDTVILNVVGHSRGAIAALWFMERGFRHAHEFLPGTSSLSSDDRLIKINLITLEPVPGVNLIKDDYKDVVTYPLTSLLVESDLDDVIYAVLDDGLIEKIIRFVDDNYIDEEPYGYEPMGWDVFRLDGRLNKFVAIYASDERGKKFGAVVPDHSEILDPDKLMLRVRGSHQTMVGSKWKFGHSPLSFPLLCPYPYDSDIGEDELEDRIDQVVDRIHEERERWEDDVWIEVRNRLSQVLGPFKRFPCSSPHPPPACRLNLARRQIFGRGRRRSRPAT